MENIISVVNQNKHMDVGVSKIINVRGTWYRLEGRGKDKAPSFASIPAQKWVMDENSP